MLYDNLWRINTRPQYFLLFIYLEHFHVLQRIWPAQCPPMSTVPAASPQLGESPAAAAVALPSTHVPIFRIISSKLCFELLSWWLFI